MTYVIAAPCITDFACVDVCPVDCIEPRPNTSDFDETEQLYIDPERCVDCGACVGACPVSAIYKAELLPEKWRHYEEVNKRFYEVAR